MHCKSYSHFFSKKFQHICISLDVNFNESLTNDVVSFEQLGPSLQFRSFVCSFRFLYLQFGAARELKTRFVKASRTSYSSFEFFFFFFFFFFSCCCCFYSADRSEANPLLNSFGSYIGYCKLTFCLIIVCALCFLRLLP